MRRRRYGTGSVYKNGRTFWMQFYQNGEKVREPTGCEDRDAALKVLKLRQAQGVIEEAHGLAPAAATIADLWELVARDHRIKDVKDKQMPRYRWENHLEKRWGQLKAADFRTAHVERFVLEMRAEGMANGTINRCLQIVRRGFRLGKRQQPPLVMNVPYIPMLKEDASVRQGFLEPDQYERLLEVLPDRLKALFVCAYHVGTRSGELRKTRWEQVDLEERLILIPGSMTKNRKARTLPIYGDMDTWLRWQRERRPPDNPYVFASHGGRNSKTHIGPHIDGWEEACAAAGLEGLLFHDLRRSAVRNMKRAGVQDVVAMRISGHVTRIMYDRYNIVDEDDLHEAGELLEKYVLKRKEERLARQKAKLKRA